eukprot:1271163-Pyramimonas_sp.AAC.1
MERQRPGLGAPRAPEAPAQFLETLLDGMLKIRITDLAPLYWNVSRGCALYKSAQPGPKGKRVVHVLPVVGKSFFAELLPNELPPEDYGFQRRRRREGAIMASQVVGWRLRRA